MDFIIDAIVEWLKGLLVDGIMGNLDGLFDNVNQSVGEIATQVGTTPADWNAGVFSMIRQISETAILPIAGVILTFVMTYELIQMIGLMLPFFFLAMYERDGLPLEKVLKNIIRTRFLYPRVRPYKTENFYALLSARKEAQPIAKQQKGRKARRQKA